jgi:hypothetical protein
MAPHAHPAFLFKDSPRENLARAVLRLVPRDAPFAKKLALAYAQRA